MPVKMKMNINKKQFYSWNQTVHRHLSLKGSKECSNCGRRILCPVFLPCLLNKNTHPPADKVSILAEEQIVWYLLFSTVSAVIHPLPKIPQCPVIHHFGINWDYTLGSNGLLFFSDTCQSNWASSGSMIAFILLADLKEECSRHRLLLQPFASSLFHCKNARQSQTVSANQPAQVTLYHLKWARSALRDLWHSVWESRCMIIISNSTPTSRAINRAKHS